MSEPFIDDQHAELARLRADRDALAAALREIYARHSRVHCATYLDDDLYTVVSALLTKHDAALSRLVALAKETT